MSARLLLSLGTALLGLASASSAQSVCYTPPTAVTPGGRVLALGGDAFFTATPGWTTTGDVVEVFERGPGGWTHTQTLTGGGSDYFGVSLDTDGETLVVGYDGFPSSEEEVWLYERVGGAWVLQTILSAPPSAFDRFGNAAAVDGDRLAVTNFNEVFTFRRQTSTTWTLESTTLYYPFGGELSPTLELDGDNLLVGMPGNFLSYAGVVPLHWDGADWVLEEMLLGGGGTIAEELALDGDRFVTSDWSCPICSSGYDHVLVYERVAGKWTLTETLEAPTGFQYFGTELDLEGDRLAVGGALWSGGNVVQILNFGSGGWSALTDLQSGFPYTYTDMALDQGVVAAATDITTVVWEQDFNPEVYCVPGTTAQGCTPSMGWQGEPSTVAGSGFDVYTGGLEGQVTGLLFFGTSGRQFVPWGPNSSSTQCVAPPVQRTGLQMATGTPGQCDGVMTLDFNAWMSANPAKAPGPGEMVQFQTWFRDPHNTAKKTTSLSDALEFSICQ